MRFSPSSFCTCQLALAVVLLWSGYVRAQSTASIEGEVIDRSAAVVPAVEIRASSAGIGIGRIAFTDSEGLYQIVALPVGDYRLEIRAKGFKTQVLEAVRVEVARRITLNFQLEPGDISQQVTVNPSTELIEHATVSVAHVVNKQMVQQLPLNGRYFLDLGLLVPGSVTPPQGAFSSTPMRGLGSLTFNTAGNREEAVNYLINGITLNDLTFSSISFQPSISTVAEFKVDNSTFSAQYGQSSGAIVNIATRSGANAFHGELFEFFRNDALDARNFFTFTSTEPPPFKRNQFGGNFGGAIIKDKLFFFSSYEGLRQRQQLPLNSLVLSDSQRAAVTDPIVVKLLPSIPRANFFDSTGMPRFAGSGKAPIDNNQWTLDIRYDLTQNDQLHGYYALSRSALDDPNRNGNTVPGFGNTSRAKRQVFTLNETHVFNAVMVNEARFGFTRLRTTTIPNALFNPADLGILNGIDEPIGLPQISVAGSLNFGGPSANTSGRGNTTFVVADTLSYLRGRHSLKFGGEFRQFLNNNFRQGTGSFNFPTVEAFLAGTANSFSVTLGSQSSSIAQGALSFFAQDNFKVRRNLNLELGLRYEWNMSPSERYDRFIVFDPLSASLVRVGTNFDYVYHQNNKNLQPRVGFSWDPFKNGKTSVRGAYAIQTDQPMTSVVTPTSTNPPLAIPLTFSGSIRLDNAIALAGPAGLAPQSIDQGFDNAYLQSWNFNVQREIRRDLALMVGYFGSKGTHLILRRNINQPINGVRPFPMLSLSSPILPGVPLGNVTQVESAGNSSYNALWVTATKRLARAIQFNASYTWSKSLDYNSFSTQGVVVQDSYNLRGDRGLSDFDTRHRFVISALYELPFKGNRLVEGWQFAVITQSQSGNPVNIVTNNATVNGVANTLRPNVTGPVAILGNVDHWFDTTVFSAVTGFGSLGRNVVIGPSLTIQIFRSLRTPGSRRIRGCNSGPSFLTCLITHFGQPGNIVGSPTFGMIAVHVS